MLTAPHLERRKRMLQSLTALDLARQVIADEVQRQDKAEGKDARACSFCGRSHTHGEVGFTLKAPDGVTSICDLCIDVAEDQLSAARLEVTLRTEAA